jgi:hypothetical protein
MKNRYIILLTTILFANCQKELSLEDVVETVIQKNERLIQGKWKFQSFTDSTRKTVTNSNPCWADNTLTLKTGNQAVISQGDCIETPAKPKDVEFKWVFISDDVVEMGMDTVKLIVNNDTVLQFRRINKSFLEYKWKK